MPQISTVLDHHDQPSARRARDEHPGGRPCRTLIGNTLIPQAF